MEILVVGSGGREHALCSAFARSPRVTKVFCAPGNPGITALAECVALGAEQVGALADFAAANEIDVTFVGGETALALGIVDEFENRGLRIVGPCREAAQLESSKAFAKDFMSRYGIPTARFEVFSSEQSAIDCLQSGLFGTADDPVVVKADGLAAGKGVVVAANRTAAIAAVRDLTHLAGTAAADKIVIEECLVGHEVSMLMFASGEDFVLMPPTRDHKRIGDGDVGPNTGGMGAITDATLLSAEERDQVVRQIIVPTLQGLKAETVPFRGILFLGLMMTASGPKLLEYNVRFGDPETQAILVRLVTDLTEICDAVIDDKVDELEVEWRPGSSACVVLAAGGYPARPVTGAPISGIEKAEMIADITVFQAGTARGADGELLTGGGRVLGVTAVGSDLADALASAYQAVDLIEFDGMQFRRDIGGGLK